MKHYLSKKYITISLSRFRKPDFQLLFSIFIGIFLYFFVESGFKIWFIFLLLPIMSLFKIKYFMFAVAITFALIILFLMKQHNELPSLISHKMIVTNKVKSGIIVEYQKENIYINTKINAYPGDMIYAAGRTKKIEGDYVKYFNSLNVKYQLNFPQRLGVVSHSNDFRNILYKFVDHQTTKYSKYVNLLWLSRKTVLNNDIYNLAIQINITHLFVISGFHFALLFFVIKKFLTILKFSENFTIIFSLLVIFFYGYLIRFNISSQRAIIFIMLITIKKMFNLKYSNIFLLGITFLLVILLNVNNIYSYTLYLTFFSTYLIIYINEFNFKTQVQKYLSITTILFLLYIPYSAFMSNKISVFGILFIIVFSPLIPIFYFLIWIFWFMPDVLVVFLNALDILLKFANEVAINVTINGFNGSHFKLSYIVLINLFIIYLWLNWFLAKKNTR